MSQREKIDWLGAPIMECLVKMSEGNPGAATVLGQLLNKPVGGVLAIMKLDDHDIRGHEIWIGYKDLCDQDIDKFHERAQKHTRTFAAEIKQQAGA